MDDVPAVAAVHRAVLDRGEGVVDRAQELRAGLLDDREVEVELGGEVAVEDGLGDLGADRDVVHRDVVEAVPGEQVAGHRQHLDASGVPPHPGAAGAVGPGVVTGRW